VSARLAAGLGAILVAIAACTTVPPVTAFPGSDDPQVSEAIDRRALPGAFTICHGYGCQWRSPAGLTTAEWRSLSTIFAAPAATPAEERERVRSAVALIEKAVGERIGTIADKPRTPFSFMDRTQLDCVDESINTSTTLHLLHGAGLLRWHTPGEPSQRGRALFFNIHFTAVLIETGTGARYAVDTWFFEPGAPPAVMPIEVWRDGWQPGDPMVATAR
jgi:hypothetical protein